MELNEKDKNLIIRKISEIVVESQLIPASNSSKELMLSFIILRQYIDKLIDCLIRASKDPVNLDLIKISSGIYNFKSNEKENKE